MPIRVKCESCKKTLSVKDHLAGKKIKCPVCQNVVVVPMASPTKEPSGAKGPIAPKKDPPAGAAPKKPAPTSQPAPIPAAKKPAAATKPIVKTKPTTEKPDSNGTPVAKTPPANGTPPPKAPEPEPIELPPENVESEALAAFAEDLKPPEEPEEPKTIEFKCDWCDEKVTFPIDMAGKQAQCPHEECRRIIKVPLPKKAEKKDWRKMDKQGPAMARINQPEQLENAWGTEEASKARQDSLKQAGAIEEPPRKGRDLYDMVRWACYAGCALAFLAVIGAGFWKMSGTKRQQVTIQEVRNLVEPPATAKIKTPSLASAETHRAIAMLYLQSNEKDPAFKAMKYFQGAAKAADFKPTKSFEGVNEQLFLIELALWQIDMGEEDDQIFNGANLSWPDTQAEIGKTLANIVAPEVQVMALREVGARLIDKKKPQLAVGLTAAFSADPQGKKLPYRQQIALIVAKDHANLPKDLPPSDPKSKDFNSYARVGHAEGFAWTDRFDDALKLLQPPGPVRDRFEAALGVAAVALARKNKPEAARFVDEAFKVIGEMKAPVAPTDWQKLQLIKLAARTDKAKTAEPLFSKLPREFQLRGHLEIFLAFCDATPTIIDSELLGDKLNELEELEKKAPAKQEGPAGNSLALAWLAIARHNATLGASRDANRKLLENRLKAWTPPPGIDVEMLRAIVDVGTYQGTKK
jgi:hypothetical protein